MTASQLLHPNGSPSDVGGTPLWFLTLDRRGRAAPETVEVLADLMERRGVTDAMVLAHGWNNDRLAATTLYHRLFGEISRLMVLRGVRDGAIAGYLGVFWPSVRWPDASAVVRSDDGGAASGTVAAGSPAADDPNGASNAAAPGSILHDAIADAALALYTEPDERSEMAGLLGLLRSRPESERALEDFVCGLRRLALDEFSVDGGTAAALPDEDALEGDALFAPDWRELLDTLASREPPMELEIGGAASLGPLSRLWRGARGALRLLSYWTMKRRSGIVGQDGLGPLIARLAELRPGIRVHLIGHSFGARLASYALKGLPDSAEGELSPVKSLLLLQGAFSHYSFARSLPHDPRRAGHLANMSRRVDGPLLATHSRHDTAIRYAYPLASLIARQDASAVRDPAARWGAMGDGGAQAVDATDVQLHADDHGYEFAAGRWYNLNGDHVIRRGPAPSGAHGDVVHPETAWAALQAAGLSPG